MRRPAPVLAPLLLSCLSVAAQEPAPVQPPAPPLDLPAALALSAQTGRPVLLQFAAAWIDQSNMADIALQADPGCLAATEPFVRARIEVPPGSAGRAALDTHHVVALPCWIVLAPDGREIARTAPVRVHQDLGAFLLSWLASEAVRFAVTPPTPAEEWARLQERFTKDGPSPEAVRRLSPLAERLESPSREEALQTLENLRGDLSARMVEAREAATSSNGGTLGATLASMERFAQTPLRAPYEEEISALRGSCALESHIAGQIERLADPDWEIRTAARVALRVILPLVRDRIAALRDSPDAETALACAELLRADPPPAPRVRLRINDVIAGSQGEAAGIGPGDVILAHGDRAIHFYTELATAVNTTDESERITLRLERDGRPLEIEIHGGRIGVSLEEVEE